MKLYLAYGANTNLTNMSHRCPEAKYVCNVTINHHRLVFRGVADVVAARGSRVVCAMWTISPKDEAALDRFEGFPNLYVKRYITIHILGRKHRVMFYVMRRNKDEGVPPAAYEATLREGYAQCGMPIRQIDNAIRRAKEWTDAHPHLTPNTHNGSWGKKPIPNPITEEDVDAALAAMDRDAADEFMSNYYEQQNKEDHNA